MARDDDAQQHGIRLDDGTWVDVGPDGKWRPTWGERARAAVILTVAFGALLVLALAVSTDDDPEEAVEPATTTTTTEATTTTAAVVDPSSIDGEPASERCRIDDRSALPLRDRPEVTVLVLNGAGRTGHAGAITGDLADLGYATIEPGNAERRDVTAIGFLGSWCAEAERVAEDLALPGATVEPVSEDLPVPIGQASVVVTLGADSL